MLLRPLHNLTQLLCCMSWNIDPILLLFTARARTAPRWRAPRPAACFPRRFPRPTDGRGDRTPRSSRRKELHRAVWPRHHLVGRREDEFRVLVDELLDEPRTSYAVHLRMLAGDPFHVRRSLEGVLAPSQQRGAGRAPRAHSHCNRRLVGRGIAPIHARLQCTTSCAWMGVAI